MVCLDDRRPFVEIHEKSHPFGSAHNTKSVTLASLVFGKINVPGLNGNFLTVGDFEFGTA